MPYITHPFSTATYNQCNRQTAQGIHGSIDPVSEMARPQSLPPRPSRQSADWQRREEESEEDTLLSM